MFTNEIYDMLFFAAQRNSLKFLEKFMKYQESVRKEGEAFTINFLFNLIERSNVKWERVVSKIILSDHGYCRDLDEKINGYTLLHRAVILNRPLIVKALMKRRANPFIESSSDKTAFHYAIEYRRKEIFEQMKKVVMYRDEYEDNIKNEPNIFNHKFDK